MWKCTYSTCKAPFTLTNWSEPPVSFFRWTGLFIAVYGAADVSRHVWHSLASNPSHQKDGSIDPSADFYGMTAEWKQTGAQFLSERPKENSGLCPAESKWTCQPARWGWADIFPAEQGDLLDGVCSMSKGPNTVVLFYLKSSFCVNPFLCSHNASVYHV